MLVSGLIHVRRFLLADSLFAPILEQRFSFRFSNFDIRPSL